MAGTVREERPADAGRFPRDFWVGIFLLAFCALAYWVTLSFKMAPAALAQNVQPATFPRLVLSVLSVLSLIMILTGLNQPEPRRRFPKPVMLITVLMMLGFVLAFEFLGLIVAMGIFCLIMPVFWGARPSLLLVAFAIAFPTTVYLVFALGLGVYFSPGILSSLVPGLT